MKVVIVLGYKLNDDASMEERLVHRLDLCLKLINEESYDKIIVSGGCPTPPGLEVSDRKSVV